MRKRLGLGCVLSLLGWTVACHAASAEAIVWWNWNDVGAATALQPLISDFTKQTGIQVEAVSLNWADLPARLKAGIAGGIAPDVISVSSDWFAPLAAEGMFTDLAPEMAADSSHDESDIFPAALKMWQGAGGQQYALPFDLDVPDFWYNTAMFASAGISRPSGAGWDWNTWIDDAIKLTKSDAAGRPQQFGYATAWVYPLYRMVWAEGGTFFRDGKPSLVENHALDTALSYLKRLYAGSALMRWSELAPVGSKTPQAAFEADRLAMAEAGTWVPSYYFRDKTGGWASNFAVAPIPISPTGERAAQIGGQGTAVVASSTHQKAAFAFVEWLSGNQTQTASAKLGQFPVRRNLALSDAFLSGIPVDKHVVVDTIAYAHPAPARVDWSKSKVAIRKALLPYLQGTATQADAVRRAEAAADAA